MHVYVLRLEGDRFYVGSTATLQHRLEAHASGRGSAWTREHKPVRLEAVHTVATEEDAAELERLTTEQLRQLHGDDRVRGGGFSGKRLPGTQGGEEAHARA